MTPEQITLALMLFDLHAGNLLQGANAQAATARDDFVSLLRTLAAQQARADPVACDLFAAKRAAMAACTCPSCAAAPAVRAPLTEAHVAAVVRSVQPCLSDESKAWRNQSAECRYWLEADRAVTQEQTR
ncbi:MAG: hypothetical protein KA795_19075 [Burkholderiaceae bacterium]|nr:hypothetical protein [Burkholderiaceae bacterium]